MFDEVIVILAGTVLIGLSYLVYITRYPPVRTFHVHVALKPTINDLYVSHDNICTIYTCRAPELMGKIEADMKRLNFNNHRAHILKIARL